MMDGYSLLDFYLTIEYHAFIIMLGRARTFFEYNADCIRLKEESHMHLGWLEGE